MDLNALAEKDLANTLERDGHDLTLTNPAGVSASLRGQINDIGFVIDPETGMPVVGRNINATLRISSIKAKGLEIPTGVYDTNAIPWRLEFTNGVIVRTKVISPMPDRILGMIGLKLEVVA